MGLNRGNRGNRGEEGERQLKGERRLKGGKMWGIVCSIQWSRMRGSPNPCTSAAHSHRYVTQLEAIVEKLRVPHGCPSRSYGILPHADPCPPRPSAPA